METMIASPLKEQRLRGISLAKKMLENQRKSHEESIIALQNHDSDLSKAVRKLTR